MNGGFRVRPDGAFVANSLNSKTSQKGIQDAGKTNDMPGTAAQTGQRAGSSPLPSISIPKGGGAIRGMGEKFAANPVTGTGSLNVSIFTSPGRLGFGPQLSLSYDSGSGNGPFGFGWNLSLPSITRKTDKGLPRYQDATESDVFILSGAEDLVPVFKKDQDGNWIPDPKGGIKFDAEDRGGYVVRSYRPRIEGLFARIERWTSNDGDVHWRSISKDNILTVYGRDEKSRIADPADENRIFSWLICESYDDKGNAIIYEYAAENEIGIDLSLPNELNRAPKVNRYLKSIKYGNRKPLLLDTTELGFRILHVPQPDFETADWMFTVVFDYGEAHYHMLPVDISLPESEQHRFVQASESGDKAWSVRRDPFSVYRAGFEVRTYRRCHRVLMFHRFKELFRKFPELEDQPYLVRSTEFDYQDMNYSEPVAVEEELKHKGSTRFASFIQKITQSGYVRDESRSLSELNGVKYLTYIKKSLPPLEFEYSKAVIQEEIKEISAKSLENLPYGLDGSSYQWVDLDGEGVSGILTEQAGTWFYKPNLGDGKFGPIKNVVSKPSLSVLNSGRTQLLDLAGDGQLDVVEFDSSVPGFYERTHDKKWENFIPFTSLPNIFWKDPNLRFVDLTGDGHADIMITEDKVFTWYPSLAEVGFGAAERIHQVLDEEKGPRVVFADGTQSIYLSDVSGDGLTDLVRIRNGEVCYWPNLGYGRFGSRVNMDNAPRFDSHDQFDHRRIRLADIDGSGTTDIIYLGRNGVSIYFNHSGNSWSSAKIISSFPRIDNLSSVQVADLFGNGTACLVWSSPLPGDARHPMRYIDLMGGQKPHLLCRSKNNLGTETSVHYAASTKFYLADKTGRNPWITRLPFPVHVVERVETCDCISRNRFVTRYAYHHGYFDGIEREFRGFGMVEQWDTEEIGIDGSEETGDEDTNRDAASFVPPVLTRTWFHTGAYFEEGRISKQFEEEYYREGDPGRGEGELSDEEFQAMLLPDTELPGDLGADEAREACRSLKGGILRQEVYALDRLPDGTLTEESDRPYTVSERNYTIKSLQPRGQNKHAVFFVHPRETLDFHYERRLVEISGNKHADPRVSHQITLNVDDFGNVERSVAIGYPRREVPDRLPEQTETHIALTVNRFINSPELPIKFPDIYLPEDLNNWYRAGVPSETQTFEIVKPPKPEVSATSVALFKIETLRTLSEDLFPLYQNEPDPSMTIPYEMWNWRKDTGIPNETRLRLIERVRTLYRKNDLTGFLPPGQCESLALPGESYKLAFTKDLLAAVYQRELSGQVPENLLPDPSAVLESKSGDGGGYVDLDGNGNWWIPSGQVFYGHTNDAAQELDFASRQFFLPHRFSDQFGFTTDITYDSSETDPLRDHNLLMTQTRDPLDNTVTAQNNYRVLQPELVSDPNGAISEVLFDAQGMVVATAVHKGDAGDSLLNVQADLTRKEIDDFFADPGGQAAARLGTATSYIIYDVERHYLTRDTDKPPYAAAIARETHVSDPVPEGGLKVQVSFSYSDGFGREIQKKIQAEPGHVNGVHTDPRWVGSGWTIFNNKGKPVRKYEPFFDDTHDFRYGNEVGVSTTLFYDPFERVVATLHPNDTYEKVAFDPWHQKTYDVNDTVTFNPRTDKDIQGYVVGYFSTQPATWQTWYEQRINGALGAQEQKAAQQAAAHADTPTAAYSDTLGRTFLTVADNGADGKYQTRVIIDIEGNQREVIDAKDRIVMQYDYDMLGNQIHQSSMEAGERWILNDVSGNPIRAWDSRGHNFRTEYDELRRPVHQFVRGTDADRSDPRTFNTDVLFGKIEYGEGQANDSGLNLRTRVFRLYDGAGAVTSMGQNPVTGQDEAYDFKGNLLRSTRDLASDHKSIINWSDDVQIDGSFSSSTTYDALNRPIQMVAPHRAGAKLNVIQPVYNEANLLEREDVWLELDAEPEGLLDPDTATQHAVDDIDYNEKGQRKFIEYGNSVRTNYEYDEKTFRMIHLNTVRGNEPLQDISYTYDPAGNITSIRDDAQPVIHYNGEVVKPESEYRYDAIYRLIESHGREHIGQASIPNTTWNDEGRVNLSPNDGQAMRNYFEFYEYDEVGNILKFDHKAQNGNWIRAYEYEEASLIEPNMESNRLSRTILHPDGQQPITEPYTYDLHGSMTSMPHLSRMEWDFEDQMQYVEKGSEKAYYVYDASGQRVRKVVEKNNGTLTEERIYLGGFEVFLRKNVSGDVTLERETLHIMDDKQRIALVETRTIDTENVDKAPRQLVRYQLGNHLGSVVCEFDEEAHRISCEEYYPYGSTSYQAVRSQTETPKRYRYTGKERDEETGLYYHGARYYAPWVGRWTSCDPAGPEDGPNTYIAFANSPPNTIDPNGMQANESEPYNPFARYTVAHRALHQAIVSHAPAKEVSRLQEEYNEAATAAQWAVDIPYLKFFAKETAKAVIGELTGLALVRFLGWGVRLLANTRAGQYLIQPILTVGAQVVKGVRGFLDKFSQVGRELAELESQNIESLIAESLRLAPTRAGGPSGRPHVLKPPPPPTSPPKPGQIIWGQRPSPTAAMPIGGAHSEELATKFIMPEGTYLVFPVRSGEELPSKIAEFIENTGQIPTRIGDVEIFPIMYGPGDVVPQHILYPENWDLPVKAGKYVTKVERPTLLGDIIEENMGYCVFTGCRLRSPM